jgi:iron complex outermembrane receptor protein
MRSFFIAWIFCQVAVIAVAQRGDSLLRPVTVYGLPEERFLHGSMVEALDSALKARESSRNLSEVLSMQLPVYFRTYGSGMLAGISMRGTSPQHTAVLWNGININSFSLGQADFSILPVAAFKQVSVHEGGGSARFGSGAFGGTVMLNSEADNAQPVLFFSQEVGSFGRSFTSLQAATSAGRWNFKSSVYNLTAKNNFTILRTGERQQHASFRQSGFVQDMEYRLSAAATIGVHYWYHNADRDIQPTIGQFNSTDNQQDKNHRLVVNFRNSNALGVLSVNGGYVNDVIVFNGSRSEVTRWITSARHEFTIRGSTRVQAGAEWNHIIGRISDYTGGWAFEDRYDFLASVQQIVSSRLALSLNLRQPVVSGFRAPFLPYLGADYTIVKKERLEWTLKASLSKNYRIPTLNDRYWQNAGDLKLLPEKSYAGEIGWNLRIGKINLSNTWFAQRVDDWIQWSPDATGNFRPKNLKQVLAEGIEFKMHSKVKIGETTVAPMATYQLTRSVTTEAVPSEQYTVGKQLIYTPKSVASLYVQLSRGTYSADFSAQYSGVRFTEASNSPIYALPSLVLCNLSAGKHVAIRRHALDLRLSARNIFNSDYQLYAGHAMPGRNYTLQLTYQLNSISNEK